MITKMNPATRRRAQPLQFPCPIRICHCPDLACHFLVWTTRAEHGCRAVILAQTFQHTLRGTRWTRHESRCYFRCILRFWSVWSNVQCCANQESVLLCFLIFQTVRTVTQTLTNLFEPGATVTFHFVCSNCFLPLKPNPSAIASVCFGSCVRRNLQRPMSPSCAGTPWPSEIQGRCVHRFSP